ncbi:hypothetical protein [Salinigranum sp. GCM10025319]|uniref:hypothetical protein n=1 Tax=Salinigranum sp. GCM10025319 TaxID=3252687 RepID=UPI003620F9CF
MDTGTEDFERIPLTEWRRLRDALDRVCTGGVDESKDRLTCRFGGASFTVDRAGTVEAGMPLHGFEASGVEAVGVDSEAGELLVETADARYVFRRP